MQLSSCTHAGYCRFVHTDFWRCLNTTSGWFQISPVVAAVLSKQLEGAHLARLASPKTRTQCKPYIAAAVANVSNMLSTAGWFQDIPASVGVQPAWPCVGHHRKEHKWFQWLGLVACTVKAIISSTSDSVPTHHAIWIEPNSFWCLTGGFLNSILMPPVAPSNLAPVCPAFLSCMGIWENSVFNFCLGNLIMKTPKIVCQSCCEG